MTDWTSKKRGFSGNKGNLGANINPMSFNRKTRELLGNLFQTKLSRKTADGEIIVRAFGKYEKFRFETPAKTEDDVVLKERLVLHQAWDDTSGNVPSYDYNNIIQLIDVGKTNYNVIARLVKSENKVSGDMDWYPYTVSWNIDRNCFIAMGVEYVFVPEYGYFTYVYYIYEIIPIRNEDGSYPMTSATATRVAKFYFGSSWYETGTYYDWMLLHTTYDSDGTLQMWLGFGETAWWNIQGIFYFLPLNSNYGFTNASGVQISPTNENGDLVNRVLEIADCENYLYDEPPAPQPRLVWVAPKDIRITKSTDEPEHWEDIHPIRRGCISGNRFSYIRDTFPQAYYGDEFQYPMAIDETIEPYASSTVLVNGKKETPPAFLENKRRVYTGWNYNYEKSGAWTISPVSFTGVNGYLVFKSTYPSMLGDYPVEVVVFDYYLGTPPTAHETQQFFYSYDGVSMQYEMVQWTPYFSGTYEVRENPFGGASSGVVYVSGNKTCAVLCWYHDPTYLDYVRENIADVRYITKSKRYVVMGADQSTSNPVVRVLNESGGEVYQIPFEHSEYADKDYIVLNSLERVFIK